MPAALKSITDDGGTPIKFAGSMKIDAPVVRQDVEPSCATVDVCQTEHGCMEDIITALQHRRIRRCQRSPKEARAVRAAACAPGEPAIGPSYA